MKSCTYQKWSELHHKVHLLQILFIAMILTLLVITIIAGNLLVIIAVLMKRRLRTATGMLILSLAAADLLVGIVILPISSLNEILEGYWIFGDLWCTIWLTMDIWMCTASIYSLVAISIDRFIAIIKPLHYPTLVTRRRAHAAVAAVWISSFLVCSPSFLVAGSHKSETDQCRCTPAHASKAYIIFSASSSFYVPMIVVIFIYIKIYIAARRATKGMVFVHSTLATKVTAEKSQNTDSQFRCNNKPPNVIIHKTKENVEGTKSDMDKHTARIHYINSDIQLPKKIPHKVPDRTLSDPQNIGSTMARNTIRKGCAGMRSEGQLLLPKIRQPGKIQLLFSNSKASKSSSGYEKKLELEIRAAKTVAIVTGCFIFCWLGFSILYGFSLNVNPFIWSTMFWLGYVNSALNPIIYTLFNRDFRKIFKKIMTFPPNFTT